MVTGKPLSFAIWMVKNGKRVEFVNLWKSFSRWTDQRMSGQDISYLIQDTVNPDMFVSYGFWSSNTDIETWQATREFKEFYHSANELCTSIEPHVVKVVTTSKE